MSRTKRFVVFSHGRAGTNFLMNNLSSHASTMVAMEPFHNDLDKRYKVNGEVWKDSESSADFAYNVIYNCDSLDVQAVGFKLFYFHCRQNHMSASIWKRLQEDTDVHVIFLNRWNLLNKYLSDLRAMKSGIWHPTKKDYMDNQYKNVVDVHVDVPKLMRAMSELYCGYHRTAETFKNHPTRHYLFEDLADKSDEILTDAYTFLGLSRAETSSSFKAGTLSPKTTNVINADEVRDAVYRSVFSDYLDTCPIL